MSRIGHCDESISGSYSDAVLTDPICRTAYLGKNNVGSSGPNRPMNALKRPHDEVESKCFPIMDLLQSLVRPEDPILFFPEYAVRRIGSAFRHELSSYDSAPYPSELKTLFSHLFEYTGGDKSNMTGISVSKEDCDVTNDDNDPDIHLRIQLAFTIVLPSSSAVAEKVSGINPHVVWKQSPHVIMDPDNDAGAPLDLKPTNKYKKAIIDRGPESILCRSQTLASLVDGVICKLVQTREKEPRAHATSQGTRNTREYRGNKRKRQRTIMQSMKKIGRNILCDGYDYFRNQTIVSSHCSNMAPGIHCRQANSSSAFARSSPLMHYIHRIMGDDLLRELLMHTIVLIPLVNNHKQPLNSSHTWIQDCNYFQLCGRQLLLESNNDVASTLSGTKRYSTPDQGQLMVNNLKPTHSYSWNPHETIPRAQMFYCESFTPKVGFPPNHIMNSAVNKNKRILESMLQISTNPIKRGKKRRMDIVHIQGETLCQEIAMNHSKCDYARLLERYCPLSSSHKATSQNLDDDVTPSQDPSDTECTQLRLIKSYYTAESAGSFIKAVISRLFPLQFWGSQVNLDVFLETLMRFIALQRGETFTLKTIMHRIRVMDMKWLIGTADRTAISRFMHQAVCYSVKNIFKWVYCVIIIPLLRSAFYITDTQLSKYPIFYRKPIWSRIKFLALTELESSKQFEKKGCQLSSANKLGASKLRFLPKTSGLRPIANLAMPYWDSSMLERPKKVLCTNAILRKVFEVLKYELQSKPTSFGFGMQYDHIHSRFVDFMIKVQERRLQAPSTETNIYFASVDIHRCFDNINQDFLFKILEGFIAEDEYLLQKYILLHQSGKNGSKFRLKTHVENASNIVPFHALATEQLCLSYKRTILVDAVNCSVVKRKEILELLHEHLFRNIVVVQDYGRPRILQQKTGIAQGSILSTLLCNLYYGFNETELLDGLLVNNHSACQVAHVHGVFRVVDDFLFVSTEKEKAIRFLEKMHIGMPAKGIKVNGEKSRCSFDFRSDLVSVEKVVSKDAKGGYYFSWCGLLFNTDSGSVRIDYERFSGDRAIQSIFLKARGSEGLNLVTSMRGFVQPRATAILYDLRINTVYDINLNYCQAVLLCIIKTHTFITRMDGGYEKNPTFLLSAFEENLVYFYRLIRTRLQREKDEVASRNDSPAVSFTNALKLQSAKWLGIYLFSSFLVDRSSESHTMVALLRLRLFGFTLMNRKALKALADEALASFYLTVLKENNEH